MRLEPGIAGATEAQVPRRWLWSVLPRFDETLTPELWRFTGKLRTIVMSVLIALTLLVALRHERLEDDQDVFMRLVWFHMASHGIDLVIGLWIWKGRASMTAARRLTYVCVAIEAFDCAMSAWIYGTVSSHMIGFALVLVLTYRLSFDFRIGVTAFLLLLVCWWGFAISEASGWIPKQPAAEGVPDRVYLVPAREIAALVFLTFMTTVTFVLANWAVARMRFRDVTIRMLREQLQVADAGRVGRHTGRTLSDTYQIHGLVGAGGMGEVYAGEHLRTRRRVAVKLLHPHLVEDPQVLARFRREAEAIGRLGSEHIVEVVDVGEDDGQPFLVLEYLEGQSLSSMIAARPLELTELDEVVRQLARGLDVAHQAGVVHRDLKPDNVYVARRDDGTLRIKILDFGVSKVRDHATAITREVAILGTPDYMSPEQAVGLTDAVDERTDLFSLGAIIYCAITGRPPFSAASVPAQLRRICDEEPVPIIELRADAPFGLVAVVTIAMAKRAEERYARAGELAADLSAAIAGTLDPEVVARAARIHRARPASREVAAVALGADQTALAHSREL